MAEALGYIALHQWGHDLDSALVEVCTNPTSNIFKDFRQRAFDGRITVWGRHNRHDIYRALEAKYWGSHQLDGGAMINGRTRTWGNDGDNYIDLMVSRAEIEREWNKSEKPE